MSKVSKLIEWYHIAFQQYKYQVKASHKVPDIPQEWTALPGIAIKSKASKLRGNRYRSTYCKDFMTVISVAQV